MRSLKRAAKSTFARCHALRAALPSFVGCPAPASRPTLYTSPGAIERSKSWKAQAAAATAASAGLIQSTLRRCTSGLIVHADVLQRAEQGIYAANTNRLLVLESMLTSEKASGSAFAA